MVTAQLVVPTTEGRTARRRVVDFNAYVREMKADVSEVQLADLSTDGCRFRCDRQFETATLIWLKIAGVGGRQAKVVWARDGFVGCEFVSPLQAPVVQQLADATERELKDQFKKRRSAGFGQRH